MSNTHKINYGSYLRVGKLEQISHTGYKATNIFSYFCYDYINNYIPDRILNISQV